MVDETKSKQADTLCDDILPYEQAQAHIPVEDPLSAIKTMRLEQLAVCRLKSEQEIQAMRAELADNADETSTD
ncbi:MAG TPA: hypothetical protein GX732_10980 [Pseudomonas sp.]|nr:hypothetical protein [Pseudomonas sp.]HHX06644.1 hypothetical protein [Pseudomonas sp.]